MLNILGFLLNLLIVLTITLLYRRNALEWRLKSTEFVDFPGAQVN